MSCPHGNPIGGCDTCDEVDAAFEAGKRSALAEQPAQQEPVCVKFNEGLWQEREARISQLEAELMRMQGRELKLQFALAEQPAQQQEPVAWMHEWEDGERIPMLTGRDDRNNDQPKSVRPLVYGDTPPQAQPAQQEPVFWQILNGVCHAGVRSTKNLAKEAAAGMQKIHDLGGSLAAFHVRPLYKSPPASKPWVGLTDEDHAEVKDVMIHVGVGAGVAWIENKLRERNT